MECKKEQNKINCNCSYNCPSKGICCDCVKHHREKGQIPACFFDKKTEMTYDRSIKNFIKNTTIVD